MKKDRVTLIAGFLPAAIMAILFLLENLQKRGILPNRFWIATAAEIILYLAPTVLLCILYAEEAPGKILRFRRATRKAGSLILWISLTAALLALLLNCSVSAVLGQGYYQNDNLFTDRAAETFWQRLLLTLVIAPILEELFFRGVLFSSIEREGGVWPALLLSSVAFALLHGSPYQLAGALAAGMIYGYLTYTLNSVLPAIFAHIINNGFSLLLQRSADAYSTMGLWPYLLLVLSFFCFLFLALAMRALEKLIEEGKIRRFHYRSLRTTLENIFVVPGFWLLLILFLVRVLY